MKTKLKLDLFTDLKHNTYIETPTDDFDIDSLEETTHNIRPNIPDNTTQPNTEIIDSKYIQNKMLTESIQTVSSSGYDTTDDTSSDESSVKVYRKMGRSGLQHSGEMHESIEIVTYEGTSANKRGKTNALNQTGLQHTGEIHDSLGYLDEPAAAIGTRRKRSAKDRQHLEHSGEMHDTIDIFLSSEELSQGQVYVIIVSCLTRYKSFISIL